MSWFDVKVRECKDKIMDLDWEAMTFAQRDEAVERILRMYL